GGRVAGLAVSATPSPSRGVPHDATPSRTFIGAAVFDRQDENAAVTGAAGASRVGDGVRDRQRVFVAAHHLELGSRGEIHRIRRTPVEHRVSWLGANDPDLRECELRDVPLLQRVLYRRHSRCWYDRLDLLHDLAPAGVDT